jgi:hypothetical protein
MNKLCENVFIINAFVNLKIVLRTVYDKKHKLMVSNCTCGWCDHELATLQETLKSKIF